MKKLLSKILVVMMILTTMVPAVSFATDDVEKASVDSAAKKFNVKVSDVTTNSAILILKNTVSDGKYSATVEGGNGGNCGEKNNDNQIAITGLTYNTKYTAIVTETITVPAVNSTEANEASTNFEKENKKDTEITVEFTTAIGPECPISLIVQYGGIAISSLGETIYTPKTYTLSASAIGTISAYSNAGYEGKKNTYTIEDQKGGVITVKFNEMNAIYPSPYAIPYYVTDGFFSGLNADGSDISPHDPKGDVLSAELTATPDAETYDLGATANITLKIDEIDGDRKVGDDTDKYLVEVDFYENGILKDTFADSSTSNPAIYSYVIPNEESALTGAGFTFNNNNSHYKIYTKKLKYDLVDRYNSKGAAAIIDDATANLVVKFQKPNLWVAADNWAQVYIDGDSVASNGAILDTNNFNIVQTYTKAFSDKPFVAAKAWDGGVVAGFKLVLLKNKGTNYLVTNDDWYYYTGEGEPNVINGKKWFDESYVGNEWAPVTQITDSGTTNNWHAQFPTENAYWIWNDNYKGLPNSQTMEGGTSIYLRSMAPKKTGTLIINKSIEGTEINTTVFSFDIYEKNTKIKTVTASAVEPYVNNEFPEGKYTVKEVDLPQNWSVTKNNLRVTVCEESEEARVEETECGIVTFVNTYTEPIVEKTFTVTYDPGTQLTAFTAISKVGLTQGAITPTAPAMEIPDGYTFSAWEPSISETVKADVTYTAIWTPVVVDEETTTETPRRRSTPVATIVETAPPLVEQPVIEAVIEEEPVALAEDPNVPQTSDSNNILLLLSLLFASGLGIVTLGRRKENTGK